jgi:hypothetical protein
MHRTGGTATSLLDALVLGVVVYWHLSGYNSRYIGGPHRFFIGRTVVYGINIEDEIKNFILSEDGFTRKK